jgi:hypothetical protein
MTFVLTVVAITIACAEVTLLAYRRFIGVNRYYPWAAALIRTIAYSPCILGAGHGAMPLLLGPALWFLFSSDTDVSIVWLLGIPEVAVATICFSISYALRREKVANQPPQTTRAFGPRV